MESEYVRKKENLGTGQTNSSFHKHLSQEKFLVLKISEAEHMTEGVSSTRKTMRNSWHTHRFLLVLFHKQSRHQLHPHITKTKHVMCCVPHPQVPGPHHSRATKKNIYSCSFQTWVQILICPCTSSVTLWTLSPIKKFTKSRRA